MSLCDSVQDWLSFECQDCSQPFALSNAGGVEYNISFGSPNNGEVLLADHDSIKASCFPYTVLGVHLCMHVPILTGFMTLLTVASNLLAVCSLIPASVITLGSTDTQTACMHLHYVARGLLCC